MTTLQKSLIAIYLDYLNNYLTPLHMSKSYLMSEDQMLKLITIGKELHAEDTQLKLDLDSLAPIKWFDEPTVIGEA